MTEEIRYSTIKNRLDSGADIVSVLNGMYSHVKIPFTYNTEFENSDIECLELSVRSYNCLKRAGIGTLGQLMESIEGTKELLKIRNLGKRSAAEIMNRLLEYRYDTYSDEKKDKFIRRLVEVNVL